MKSSFLYFLFIIEIATTSVFAQDFIALKQETNVSFLLEIKYLQRDLRPLDWAPKLKKQILETYLGIPEHDSILICLKSENPVQYKYDSFKANVYDKADYLQFISEKNIDTSNLSKKPIAQGFIAIIGFHKNKEFIIADFNRNKDFSDDFRYEFAIAFRKDTSSNFIKTLTSLPLSNYSYETYFKGNLHKYHRKIILYPTNNESSTLEDKYQDYHCKYHFQDFWKGSIKINHTFYEIFYQGIDNNMGNVFVKTATISFSNDLVFNNQFRYAIHDTVNIENKKIVLDSLDRKISKLYFHEVTAVASNFGFSVGNYIADYQLEDLKGNKFFLSDFRKKRKYTLLDFWGTWCAPCLKMTPNLKQLGQEQESKLHIIGIAVDSDKDKVAEYIKKENLPWKNAFLKENKKIKILEDLQIQQYPTYILLDANHKIIYRGSSDSFEILKQIIEKP